MLCFFYQVQHSAGAFQGRSNILESINLGLILMGPVAPIGVVDTWGLGNNAMPFDDRGSGYKMGHAACLVYYVICMHHSFVFKLTSFATSAKPAAAAVHT